MKKSLPATTRPRKKPFSGKQKKKQLQEKKHRLQEKITQSNISDRWNSTSNTSAHHESVVSCDNGSKRWQEIVVARSKDPREQYRLNFLRELREEIEVRKNQAQCEILSAVKPEEMEQSVDEIHKPGTELDMPQRPSWVYGESKESVEYRENEYFTKYLNDIYAKFDGLHLSYFEHNLETWRQLWRVLEMSDIIAMVADIRHPVLHFSPALYNFATQTIQKPLILILNKIDLVPVPVVIAWKSYFEKNFPLLHVITFTSFPKNVKAEASLKKVQKRRPVGKRIYTTQIGPRALLQICQNICGQNVNLDSWEEKIKNDLDGINCHLDDSPDVGFHNDKDSCSGDFESTFQKHELFKNNKLTLGFVGHPNVGKSSLMNGLVGKKVVSTSVTPGHTKYFQTYYLTPTVMLCDCPGLVFPSLVHKQMQILSGIYPVAQVREPYTAVGYLASRIPIVKLLGLTHPDCNSEERDLEWTAWEVCEAWAEKRKFYTTKGRRPDVYRAANGILRMAVDGSLCMFMLPPGYVKNEKKWISDPAAAKLIALTTDSQNLCDFENFY